MQNHSTEPTRIPYFYHKDDRDHLQSKQTEV
jgi:hypothetical protein